MPSEDIEDIRDELLMLLRLIDDRLFVSITPEHKDWVKRSQEMTGRIVAILEKQHFSEIENI